MREQDLAAPAPQSFTVAEIARRHQISQGTIRRQIRDGLLEAIKIGRCTRVTARAEAVWLENCLPASQAAQPESSEDRCDD